MCDCSGILDSFLSLVMRLFWGVRGSMLWCEFSLSDFHRPQAPFSRVYMSVQKLNKLQYHRHFSQQRRNRRRDMDVSLCVLGYVFCHVIHGGNGVNVSLDNYVCQERSCFAKDLGRRRLVVSTTGSLNSRRNNIRSF